MSRKVIAEVVVDASAARRGFNAASRASKEFGDGVTTVNARVTRSLGGLEKSILGTALAFGGAAGLIAGARTFVDVAVKAQATAAKLDTTIKTMGGSVAGLTPIVKSAEAAGRQFGFTNEQTSEAMNTLIRAFGATPAAIAEMTAAQNLARASNMTLADSTTALVRLQFGNIRTAKQFGLVLPDLSSKVWAHKAALDNLNIAEEKGKFLYDQLTQRIQGQAAAFSGTAAGALQRFHAQIVNLEQSIGTALLPTVTKWANSMSAWLSKAKNQERVTHDVHAAVKLLTEVVQAFTGAIKRLLPLVQAAVEKFGGLRNVVLLLLGLKVAATMAGWSSAIFSVGSQAVVAAGKVGALAGALRALGVGGAAGALGAAGAIAAGIGGIGYMAYKTRNEHPGSVGRFGYHVPGTGATGPAGALPHGGATGISNMGAGVADAFSSAAAALKTVTAKQIKAASNIYGPGVGDVNAGAGGGGGGGGGSSAKSAAAKAAAALKKAKDAWAKELGDAIKHAVEVLNEQIRDFAPGLTARIKSLGQQNKALTLQAAVHTGDSLDAINAQITGNLQDQASALSTEIARFKARFGGQKGLPAYRAKLAALQAQLTSTQDAIMSSLQNAVQAAQSVFQRSFSKVSAAFASQFEAQTASLLRSLGPMFSQGSLTASEAALAAMQREDQVKSLQDAIDQAATDAERNAAQRAMAEFQLGEAAARERAAADAGYAAAVQQLTDERTAQEAAMTDALNKWAESVQNGTGNIGDLAAIADTYGIHIDKLAIPSIDDLFSATDSLSSAFVALANYIYQLTGVAPPASALIGNIALRGSQYQGMQGMPSLDNGGTVTRTGLAEVHRGETYSGTGGPTTLQLILDSRIIGEVVWKELLRLQGRNGSLGFA